MAATTSDLGPAGTLFVRTEDDWPYVLMRVEQRKGSKAPEALLVTALPDGRMAMGWKDPADLRGDGWRRADAGALLAALERATELLPKDLAAEVRRVYGEAARG